MSNLGFELALAELEIPFARASVGDRYVIELMKKMEWNLGGENSGHIICADVTTTGDGIVSALQVLTAVMFADKSLHELKNGMKKFPQIMQNVKIGEKVNLAEYPAIATAVAAVEAKLAGKGRVLLRPSGTEPVVRVMIEGEDEALVKTLCSELADVVAKALP